MKKAEKIIMAVIFGGVPPIFLFLAGWWGSINLVDTKYIFINAFTGLALGVAIDILLFRKQLKNVYDNGYGIPAIVYLFYSICVFGFFMGFPVFNLFVGIMAGIFIGRKLFYELDSNDILISTIKKASAFTAAVMAAICFASAYIALKDPVDTARNLEGMFNLRPFFVTTPIIICIIVIGGLVLILTQYLLTKAAATAAFNRGESK